MRLAEPGDILYSLGVDSTVSGQAMYVCMYVCITIMGDPQIAWRLRPTYLLSPVGMGAGYVDTLSFHLNPPGYLEFPGQTVEVRTCATSPAWH